MKAKSANRKLTRPSDAFLPLALLIAAVFGSPELSLLLFIACFGIAALSLFSCFGVRIAFARQPSIRDVRGSVKCALLLQSLAFLAAMVVQFLFFRRGIAENAPLICAGFLVNIEHTFYEYLFAVGDRRSARLSHGLTALMTLTGLLLAGNRGNTALWIPATTGISALVAAVIGTVMGDGLKGKISAQPIRCAPRAALQNALYPLAAVALIRWIHPGKFIPGFFAGLALFALCRTPFRRSPSEARPLNLALLAVAGIAAAAWAVTVPVLKIYTHSDALPMACAMLLVAALCAFALFGNIISSE